MKEYPQIPGSTGTRFREIENAYVFDKLDGSCLRSEWSRKSGWTKHGRRNGLLDDSNPQLIPAPQLFMGKLAEPLESIAREQRWQHLVVFYEFWGVKSLAGVHVDDDPKFLTLFDAVADKKGFMSPRDFRKCFESKVDTARFIGIEHWTRGYVERVRLGQVDGITFEGVIAKAGERHGIVRAKAKTQAWIDAIIRTHGKEEGEKIIAS